MHSTLEWGYRGDLLACGIPTLEAKETFQSIVVFINTQNKASCDSQNLKKIKVNINESKRVYHLTNWGGGRWLMS